jgi:hypothetical protein
MDRAKFQAQIASALSLFLNEEISGDDVAEMTVHYLIDQLEELDDWALIFKAKIEIEAEL